MAKCTPEKFLETARPSFKKAMDSALAEDKQWTPLTAAVGIVKDLLTPIINEQGDSVKEYTPANAFLQFLRENEDYGYVVEEIKSILKGEPSSIIKDINKVPTLNELIDGDDTNPFIEAQILLEEREDNEGESDDSRSPEGRVFAAGLDFTNSTFLKGAGRLSNKDLLDISLKAQNMTFNNFIEYIKNNMDPEYVDPPAKIKGFKSWYVSNLPINRKYLSAKDHIYLSDVRYDTVNGKQVPRIEKDVFRYYKKAFETDENGRNTYINPLTNHKEPATMLKAFYEMIDTPYGKGFTLADATMKISLSDGFLSGRLNKDGELWYKPANTIITSQYLKHFDATSIKDLKLTFVGISTGSNSSNIILARILREHYEILFTDKALSKNIDKIKEGLSEKSLELLTKNNNNLLATLENVLTDTDITDEEKKFLENEIDDVAGVGFLEFFEKEKEAGNITDIHLDDYKAYVDKPLARAISKYTDFASQIARYKWYQTLMDSSFMKMGNSLDIFNRLRLMFSPGTQIAEMGNRSGVMIDPKETIWKMDGEIVDHMPYIKALGIKKYLGDGSLPTATSYFDLMKEKLGSNLRLLSAKSVQMHKSDKGFGLDKDQRHVAIPNLEIIDNNPGSETYRKTIIQTYLRDNKVYIKGPDGSNIDEFLTPDERKLSTGIYSQFNTVISYEEKSERLLYLDKPKADAAYPFQQLDLLTDLRPEYREVREILEEHMVKVAEGWSNLVVNMAKSPDALREGAKRILEYEGKDLKTEIQKHYEGAPTALHHPTLLSGLLPMITNMFIRDGMYKVRTTGRAYVGSTKLKLKPGYGRNYTPDYNGAIIGAGNKKMFTLVKNRMLRDSDLAKNRWMATETKDEKIRLLNDYLRNVDTRVLTSRIPVDSVTAVALKRLEKFTPDWDSDAVYLNPEFLFGPFRADFDGDTGQLEILPDEVSKKLINLIGDKMIFIDLPAELDDFEDTVKIKDISNIRSFFEGSAELGKTAGTQGMAYNTRSVRANLAFKEFELDMGDGTIIKVINPEELINMSYANLKPSVKEDKYSKIPGAKIMTRPNGTRFLQTSSDHEMTILANAATDNAKKLKLYSFGYRGKSSKQAKPQDWFIAKIFKIKEGGINTSYKVIYRKSTKLRKGTPTTEIILAEKYLDIPNRVQYPPAKSRKEAHAVVDGVKVILTEEQKDRLVSISTRKGSASLTIQGEGEGDLYELGKELIEQTDAGVGEEVPTSVDFIELTAKDFGGKFLKKPIKRYFKGTEEEFKKLYTAYNNQRDAIKKIAVSKQVTISGSNTNKKIVENINAKTGIKESDIVAAYTDHENKQIIIDRQGLKRMFKEKAWMNPKQPGVTPLAENQFTTAQEFENFVIMHEIGHTLYPAKPGQRIHEDGYSAYEDEMNQFALKNMNKKWTDQSVKPTGAWRRLDVNDYNDIDYFQILRKVMSFFNTSTKKNTLKENRKLQSMGEVYQISREMHERNLMSDEEFKKYFLEEALPKLLIDPNNLTLKNNVTPSEKLLATPYRTSEKFLAENNISNEHPFYQDASMLRTAHQYSIRNLPYPQISAEAKVASETWIKANAEKYFELIGKVKTQISKTKSNPTIQRIDYDEEIVEWTKKSKKEIALLPEGSDQGITYRFLEGIGNRERMDFFAPFDLLNTEILNSYKDLWEDYYHMDIPIRDKISFKKTDTSYRVVTGEKLPEDCIKY